MGEEWREASYESVSLCKRRQTSEAITSDASKYTQGQFSRLACQVLHTQSKDPGRNLPQGFPQDCAVCRCIQSRLTTENLRCRSRKLLRNVHIYLQQPICLECEAEGQPAQGADGRPEAQGPLPGSMAETPGPPWRCRGHGFLLLLGVRTGEQRLCGHPKHGLLLLIHLA